MPCSTRLCWLVDIYCRGFQHGYLVLYVLNVVFKKNNKTTNQNQTKPPTFVLVGVFCNKILLFLQVLPVSKSSQMITFTFQNGCVATLRTSGTEPKIKYYAEMCALPEQRSVADLHAHTARCLWAERSVCRHRFPVWWGIPLLPPCRPEPQLTVQPVKLSK